MLFLLILASSTINFEYNLFQVQSNFYFYFFCFFFKGFFCDIKFLYINDLFSCLLTFSGHDISGVPSSFFPYVSPKFNKFLRLRYLAYMFCPFFYLLKKNFWSLPKLALSIIRLLLLMSFRSLIFLYLSLSA